MRKVTEAFGSYGWSVFVFGLEGGKRSPADGVVGVRLRSLRMWVLITIQYRDSDSMAKEIRPGKSN